uniref:Uncharacterized protein n=1 Tax=Zea mays TaxID=4577 RepID=A0A804PYK5_MAIZE
MWTCSSIELASVELDGVDALHVGVEEPPVLLHAALLEVLVEHGEEDGLDGARVARRSPADVVDQVLVVDGRILGRRRDAASGRPPALRHHKGDAGAPVVGHRHVEGVDGGVEEVLVLVGAVLEDGARSGEERVAEVHGSRVGGVGEVGVDAGHERRAGARQEPEDGAHEPLRLVRELGGGRRLVAAEDGLRHGRGDLDAVQAGGDQRGADVLHGRDQALRRAAFHLVAHADAAEGDLGVGLDVVADPRRGRGGAGGEAGQHVIGRAGHDADARAAHGLESRLVRRVDPHQRDAVVLVHADDGARRRQVVAAHAVGHPDGLHHGCTYICTYFSG